MVKYENDSVAKSASKVSLATAASRVLGLVREQIVAYFFGAGLVTDAFVAAFRIPNLLRDLFAEGALSSAFIPIFKQKSEKEGLQKAFDLANLTISALIVIVGIVVAIGIIIAPVLVYISAKGFTVDPYKFSLTVHLTRIMFIYLLLVSISAVIMGMLNSRNIFGIPALAPAMFNFGMILAPLFLYDYLSVPIYTLAIGVLIGGVGQIVFQLPSLLKIGFKFKFRLNFRDSGLRKIGKLISPMIIGLSASRINILINTLLASLLIEGAMSYLNYAYRLMHFPLGVFGVALGTVTLPKVSGEAARDEFHKLASSFNEAFGLSLFLVIPSAVFLAGFGDDLIRLIFQRGAFDATATHQTAKALSFYSIGLVGFAGVRVAAPVFYALGDSKKPMYFSIAAVVVNIALNFVFIPIWGFAGLAGATSIAGLTNLILLIVYLRGKVEGIEFLPYALKLAKILFGAVVAFFIVQLCENFIIINRSALAGKLIVTIYQTLGFGLIYLVVMKLMKLDEFAKIKDIFRRKASLKNK